jgi:hypothetical protein
VFHASPRGAAKAPKDVSYFQILRSLTLEFGGARIYFDFCEIYKLTDSVFRQAIADLILEKAKGYGGQRLQFAFCFGCLYMGMIAEENKRNTKLGKRIKHLGVHQVVCGGTAPAKAAIFSYRMPWHEIDAHCRQRGF